MDAVAAQQIALSQLNLRLEPAMLAYFISRLNEGAQPAEISLMGVDAKTGVAIRTPGRSPSESKRALR